MDFDYLFCRMEIFTKIIRSRTMLLMCSALIAIAYSFPTGTVDDTTTNKSTALDTKEKNPLVVITEKNNPKSESVVVQFVYRSNGGNSVIESIGTDKDKYEIHNQSNKEKYEEKSHTEKEKGKQTQLTKENNLQQGKTDYPKSHLTTDIHRMRVTSLMPEEISPLSQKWPKYLFDVFNPIQPFPELQYGKSNQVNTEKIQSQNTDTYSPYYEKKKQVSLNVAGPHLNPLSIYEREFNVPIFD